MELKRYQERTLERLSDWFRLLEKAVSPVDAWSALDWDERVPEYIRRYDSSDRLVPHVCFRVPTGGGKTLLAAEAISRYNFSVGLVLWMVPSQAIYEQTKKALRNREDPYRQVLERASSGRVKILEKGDPFQSCDVANHLCVMLMSVQSANRKNNKEFLKLFQDSGMFSSFFPDEDDDRRLVELKDSYPGLTLEENSSRIRRTLANVFKLCRPIIILDEAHKAYGTKSSNQDDFLKNWVDQFDPQLVLELSATPDPSKSNILVDVNGIDLKEEEMIKLPIHVIGHGNTSWKDVLREVHAQLENLSDRAVDLYAQQSRYIRPTAVVRVPRTGRAQRDGSHLHAEDVRKFLTSGLEVSSDEVRVQSGESKELAGEDLMAEECPVRWIITKDALKEGWDYSYAYILVLLDNTSANTTVTQMMGRVLRQPQAKLTNVVELDRCYVHCSDVGVDKAVSRVRSELQNEGFGDLVRHIVGPSDALEFTQVQIIRRETIEKETARLPQVLYKDGGKLDYDRHILAEVEWDSITTPSEFEGLLTVLGAGSAILNIDNGAFRESEFRDYVQSAGMFTGTFDLAWYARQLLDIIPNPWQAARIISEAVKLLKDMGKDYRWINERRASFLQRISSHIIESVDEQAKTIFERKLREGEITFDLNIPFEFKDWYEISIPRAKIAADVRKSLFSPFYTYDLNNLEEQYVGYLDGQEAIKWWHRVAARSPEEYRLQGWRKDYIYPDFVALKFNGQNQMIIHETKGNHLEGNTDTAYKNRLLKCLQNHFNKTDSTIRLYNESKTLTGDFKILFENEISDII